MCNVCPNVRSGQDILQNIKMLRKRPLLYYSCLCLCYILKLCFCCVVVLLYLMRFPPFKFFLYRYLNFKQRILLLPLFSK